MYKRYRDYMLHGWCWGNGGVLEGLVELGKQNEDFT